MTTYGEGPEWNEAREVAGRLFKADPERVEFEITDGTVFVKFSDSLHDEQYISKAVKAAVTALLPEAYAGLKVSVI